jgi:RpiB/LacA/LacB family sugar-phosphate isomerase/HAD superfamily hydrolase (TIGR01509 family)
MRIAIGTDHAGFPLKKPLSAYIRQLGHEVLDVGTHGLYALDYPDYAEAVGHTVLNGSAERGLLISGSGVGASVAANKLPGIRAGLCHDTYSAHQGVEQDDMNVLVLGGRVIGPELARELVAAFLAATFTGEERHRRRVQKVAALEGRIHRPQLITRDGFDAVLFDIHGVIVEPAGTSDVVPYPDSVAFIKYLRRMGIKTAVVTASQHCQSVLRAARMEHLFDAGIDGAILGDEGIAGKPAPDSFLKAAEILGVPPGRAVVVEDARSGVQAGAQGGFGFVVGVARKGNAEELKACGAHVVVNDLAELLS